MNSNTKPQSDSNPASQPHLKSQHRLFALALFSGLSQRAAYLQAYPGASPRTAEVQSSRLITRADIRATLDHLHSQVETQAILTLQEKRAYLARIVRTSATDVRPGTDLVQAITTAKDGSQTLRMPDKLRAIYLDARLAGELPPLNNRPQASPPPEPQRPAHETILNQALKSICFGTNASPTNASLAPPPSSAPIQTPPPAPASSSPPLPKTNPKSKPPLIPIPQPSPYLWPPRPPIQPASAPPSSPPQTPPSEPKQPVSPAPSESPQPKPEQQHQENPEAPTPPPYLPTIRRRHIRLGRRPWGSTTHQNSGEFS